MAEYVNPVTDTAGTADDDTFIFNQPLAVPPGRSFFNIDALAGNDTLRFAVPGTGSLRFEISPINATYEGSISLTGDTSSGETGVIFTNFEIFDLTGSDAGDFFRLQYNAAAPTPTIDFDGGGGSDTLELDYSRASGGFSFLVNADGSTSSSIGTFASFESFVIYGGVASDTIRTGAGNDTIVSNPARGLGQPVPDADTVEAGGGNDLVRTVAPGAYDGGTGADRIEVYLGGAAGLANQPPLLVKIAPTVTISNGTTITNFEDFLITTGADADRFELSIDGSFHLRGGNGRDTIVSEMTLVEPQTFSIDGFALALTGRANTVFFEQMEVVFFNGGAFDDTFRLTGRHDADQINLNGAGGSDLLEADFSLISGVAEWRVNSDGTITSNRGTFLSFERFDLIGTWGNDTLVTGSADDRIDGGAGNDWIAGGGGGDMLMGGEGNDEIFAHGAAGPDTFADTLLGGAGDDVLHPGAGDTADGGDGFDTLSISLAGESTVLRLGVGADGTITNNFALLTSFERFVLSLGSGDDAVIAGAGDDDLSGGGGDDYLQGAAGNDTLRGGSGTNTLIGGTGNDSYYIEGVNDVLVEASGEGFDTVYTLVSYALGQGSNLEALVATGIGLTLRGNELDNTIIGSNGNDVLIGGGGADTLNGGAGTDVVSYAGDSGAVFVNLTLGQGYTNTAFGDTYSGIENVVGTDFGDFIIGDTAVNRLEGGAGNDVLLGAFGADHLDGGAGSDWASYEDNSGTVFVNLTLRQGFNNAADGDIYDSIENLIGGLFDDFFIGDDTANRLNGAMGADTLLGAGGADVFMFTYAPGADSEWGSPNVDLILDFTTGTDMIELAASAFAGMTPGALSASAFVLGTAAQDADDRILYDQATGKLWFDADGAGGADQVLFAVLDTMPPIAAADFMVI